MTSIQDMMANAEDGSVITLDKDYTESVIAPAKRLTVDLGGHSWSGVSGKTTLEVSEGANVTLRNGTISQQGTKTLQVGRKDGSLDAFLTLESSLKVVNKDYCAVFIGRKGNLVTSADITCDGVEAMCIAGNGLAPYFHNMASVEGGNLVATCPNGKATAIYWPQGESSLMIKGGSITGDTGIEIRAGKLTVTGGTITGRAAEFKSEANNNGATTFGAGVAVVQHTTQLKTETYVTGGTLIGKKALCEANVQGNPGSATSKIYLRVTGGDFRSDTGDSAVYSDDCRGFISGGLFTHIDNTLVDPSAKFVSEMGMTVIRPLNLDGTPMYLSNLIVEGSISSTAQGMLMGAGKLPETPVEGTVVYNTADRKYYRYTDGDWVESLPGFTTNAIDDSERPVQSQAVKAEVSRLQTQMDNRYTKGEVDTKLNGKQATITGAASTVVKDPLTAGRVVISDGAGKIASSEITTYQLNALAGLEGATPIQTQIKNLEASINDKVSVGTYNTHVSSMNTKIASVESKVSTNATNIDKKQDRLKAGDNIKIEGNVISSTATAQTITVDTTLSETSVNPVQNKVITAKINEVNNKFSGYATTTALSNGIASCLPKGGTAVMATKAIQDEQGNVISTTYVKKGEATGAYVSKGSCTSAELDTKEKVVGHVWYLTDSRKHPKDTGDTYPAGTSWVCIQQDGGLDWVPMASGKEVDLSGYQVKDVILLNRTVTWTADSTYTGYGYKGVIADAQVGAADVATVVLSPDDASSGDFAAVCDTEEEKVIIYSKANRSITIPTIVIRKG